MQVKIEKLPKATIKVTVTVESNKVKEMYEHILDEAALDTEVEGFRKGKAPREVVKEKIGVSNLYGDVINHLLQTYYPQALKENHILPLSNPKVEIKEFDLEKDFEFTATVAIRPEVNIGDFRSELKKTYKEKQDQKKIANEEKLKKGEKLDDTPVHMNSNDVIDAVIKHSELEIAELLIEDETDRIMARLVDQAQSIGLSLEQYLKAQNKTAEQLRNEYKQMAVRNLKAEFTLSHLVNEEKIEVNDTEIEETIRAAGVENFEERLKDPSEKYYVRSILQKNKLISKLLEEVETEYENKK